MNKIFLILFLFLSFESMGQGPTFPFPDSLKSKYPIGYTQNNGSLFGYRDAIDKGYADSLWNLTIHNQISSTQTANFRINGIGFLSGLSVGASGIGMSQNNTSISGTTVQGTSGFPIFAFDNQNFLRLYNNMVSIDSSGSIKSNNSMTAIGVSGYTSDIAGSYTARSWPDKNYVDSSLASFSAQLVSIITTNTLLTLTASRTTIIVNATSVTVTLPDPAINTRRFVYIRTSIGSQTAIVGTAAGQIETSVGTFSSSTSITGLSGFGWISNGTNWVLSL